MAVPIEPEEDREDASPADLMSYLSTILQQVHNFESLNNHIFPLSFIFADRVGKWW